ncbi:MAG: hypothetical protein IPF41_17370 [Flavobacteriales bacterium]|nr:hypothetical protein [Flavobacteriales bacterium]
MLNLFKRKTPRENSRPVSAIAGREAHRLSTINRAASDQKRAEAESIP